VVEPSPPPLRRHGSKWILRIGENGVRHESDLRGEPAGHNDSSSTS
jgi:hypothetical protein